MNKYLEKIANKLSKVAKGAGVAAVAATGLYAEHKIRKTIKAKRAAKYEKAHPDTD